MACWTYSLRTYLAAMLPSLGSLLNIPRNVRSEARWRGPAFGQGVAFIDPALPANVGLDVLRVQAESAEHPQRFGRTWLPIPSPGMVTVVCRAMRVRLLLFRTQRSNLTNNDCRL